ncbi:MAG: signal recognition particle-docking protein FtsY [Zetaproteobacteria bacterium]|nr:signal recognition particle-docking protein FtsY [Zetaproteobacteria bacterium]
MSLFSRLSAGLKRSRESFSAILPKSKKVMTEADWQDIEDALVMADCGAHLAAEMVELAKRDSRDPRGSLARAMRSRLRCDKPMNVPQSGPFVLLVVGVNGTGKTTTIGKLATMYRQQGKKVLIGAGDTFRAAAVEQLEVWVNRAGADIVKQQTGADPASVAFDTVQRGISRGYDVVIVDTAGRVQTDKGLMDELGKVRRVIAKSLEGAPHEVWHVVDGGTGQNALAQVDKFRDTAGTTGLIVTKLDGTAKGGILVQLVERFMLPIRYVGVGETLEDLMEFDAENFSNSLLSMPEEENGAL